MLKAFTKQPINDCAFHPAWNDNLGGSFDVNFQIFIFEKGTFDVSSQGLDSMSE